MPGVTSGTTSAEYNAAQELEGLARVFAKLDKNGDGKVSAACRRELPTAGPMRRRQPPLYAFPQRRSAARAD